MVVGALGEDAAARSPLEQALLEEIGLEHVLDRVLLLADRDRQGREADRAAGELRRDDVEQGAVGAVEARRVDLEHRQGAGRDVGVDRPPSPSPRRSRAPASAAGWRRAGVPREREAIVWAPSAVDLDLEDPGGALDDQRQVLGAVVLEPVGDAEAVAQRRGQEARRGWSRRSA